jgi:tRNA dimethylallyltransferase
VPFPLAVEVIAVFGPTASGKTAVAEALADRLGTEVVSADALQVYRGLPILTNQPSRPTRLVAIRELDETMSVGEYAPLAHTAIDELVAKHGAAVVAGGSGLYLRAAVAQLSVPPAPPPGLRERVEDEVAADPDSAHQRLRALDEVAAELVHPNDLRRLVRALELAEMGSTLAPDRSRLWSDDARHPTTIYGIDVPPEVLETRIEARTDAMFDARVVAEVRRALQGPVSRTAEAALGLRELASLAPTEARDQIVLRTRRYAAYQRKWMRRIPGVATVDGRRPPEQTATAILAGAKVSPR